MSRIIQVKTLSDSCDYKMAKDIKSLWIEVDNISVHIVRTDEGIVVDLYPLGCENQDAIATTYAFFNEAEEIINEKED